MKTKNKIMSISILVIFTAIVVYGIEKINLFMQIYTMISLAYVWMLYSLLIFKKRKIYQENKEPFSIIIPFYNERKENIIKTLSSCMQAEGEKQIILVSDGARPEGELKEFCNNNNIQLLSYEKNMGKRYAQMFALKYIKNPLTVFVDSDTIVNQDAFINLTSPFTDKRIGAATGQIILSNQSQNILTRGIAALYFSSFNFQRKATTSLGYIQVCSGALSCYRTDILKSLSHLYLGQRFLGEECSIGDDTFLTLRTQYLGYNIEYCENAIAITDTPYNLKGIISQFIRWERGRIRETIISIKYLSKKPMVFFDGMMNISSSIYQTFTIGVLIYCLFAIPIMALALASWIIISDCLYYNYVFFSNKKMFSFKILYSFMHTYILWVVFPFSLLTLRRQSNWITR